uniref:Uncharacterized protein n=1 Tax=Arundo donax TaxID=35708 RepID=A0A0A9D3A0_ARUDO
MIPYHLLKGDVMQAKNIAAVSNDNCQSVHHKYMWKLCLLTGTNV